ncbi:tRNA (5-methylaminomethyl-2-thiouridine)(34)-methyltransferase MnmD [Paracoccaceae bacterium GXU_MW_L88]
MEQDRPETASLNAALDWKENGTPVSTRFDDPYFSLSGGLDETRHVFLAGNDLPARFQPGFHIAELGFGTGLSLLTAWAAWEESGQDGLLRFTSFEAYPMRPEDMARALEAFPALAPWRDRLLAHWPESPDGLEFTLMAGDARETLPAWEGKADAWFLDGFSPAKNPELWGGDLMQAVADHTAPGGSFATYTAAGHVRRALESAGFEVTRSKGYGHKRHMSRGRLR